MGMAGLPLEIWHRRKRASTAGQLPRFRDRGVTRPLRCQTRPALGVVDDDEPLEAVAELAIQPVERLELVPDVAEGVVERLIDPIAIEAGQLAGGVEAIAGDDDAAARRRDDDELLTGRVT